MKRVFTALVLIPIVLALVLLGPQWLLTAVTAAVAALASWEFMGLAERVGAKPPRIAVLVAIFGILALGLLVYCTFSIPIDQVTAEASVSIFSLVYAGLTLTSIPALRAESNGPSLVIFLLCVVWAGDITALYVGRAWGRHKLAPVLSPNKTWEGSLGSVAGSLLVAGVLLGLAALLEIWNSTKLSYSDDVWWYWLLLAVVVNVAAQLGDLAESALKRSAGVKDSGDLLPGHGGILDRIDALLLAAPVMWYAQLIHQRFLVF